jgi:hypothetical protein
LTGGGAALSRLTGLAASEGASTLARPLELAFAPEFPCMPDSEAGEIPLDSVRWDEAPWVYSPTPEELEPIPDEA